MRIAMWLGLAGMWALVACAGGGGKDAGAEPGAGQCSFEPGLYTQHATAADVETAASCRTEFTQTLDWTGGDSAYLASSAACDLGATTTPDGCSSTCKYSDEGAVVESLTRVDSATTLSGHLTITLPEGTRCEYDLAIEKN